jgi:hypothetical protein
VRLHRDHEQRDGAFRAGPRERRRCSVYPGAAPAVPLLGRGCRRALPVVSLFTIVTAPQLRTWPDLIARMGELLD